MNNWSSQSGKDRLFNGARKTENPRTNGARKTEHPHAKNEPECLYHTQKSTENKRCEYDLKL